MEYLMKIAIKLYITGHEKYQVEYMNIHFENIPLNIV